MSRARVDYSGLQPTTSVAPSVDIGRGLAGIGDMLGSESARRADEMRRQQEELEDQMRRVRLSEIDSQTNAAIHVGLAKAQADAEAGDGSDGSTALSRFDAKAEDLFKEMSESYSSPEERAILSNNFRQVATGYRVGAIKQAAKIQQARALDARAVEARQINTMAVGGLAPPEVAISMHRNLLDRMIASEQILPGDAEAEAEKFRHNMLNSIAIRLLAEDPQSSLDFVGRYGLQMKAEDHEQIKRVSEARIREREQNPGIDSQIKYSTVERDWLKFEGNLPAGLSSADVLDVAKPFLDRILSEGLDVDRAIHDWVVKYTAGEDEDKARALISRIGSEYPSARSSMTEIVNNIERSRISEANRIESENRKELQRLAGDTQNAMARGFHDDSPGDAMAVLAAAGERAAALGKDAGDFIRDRLKPYIDEAVRSGSPESLQELQLLVDGAGIRSLAFNNEIQSAYQSLEKVIASNEYFTRREMAADYAAKIDEGRRPTVTPDVADAEYQQRVMGPLRGKSLEEHLQFYSGLNGNKLPNKLAEQALMYAPGGPLFEADPYRFVSMISSAGASAPELQNAAEKQTSRRFMDMYLDVGLVAMTQQGSQIDADFRRIISDSAGASAKMQQNHGAIYNGSKVTDPDGTETELPPVHSNKYIADVLGKDPEDLVGIAPGQDRRINAWLGFSMLQTQMGNPAMGIKDVLEESIARTAESISGTVGISSVARFLDKQFYAYDRDLLRSDGGEIIPSVEAVYRDQAHRLRIDTTDEDGLSVDVAADGVMIPYSFNAGGEVATPVYRNRNESSGSPIGFTMLNTSTGQLRYVSREGSPEWSNLSNLMATTFRSLPVAPITVLAASNRYGVSSVMEIGGDNPAMAGTRDRVSSMIYRSAVMSVMYDHNSGDQTISREVLMMSIRDRADHLARLLGYRNGIGHIDIPAPD